MPSLDAGRGARHDNCNLTPAKRLNGGEEHVGRLAMRQTNIFDVRTSRREPEPRITLARRDDGALVMIDAAALRAQYLLPQSDVVLVLDEECPFEEQLHLALVRGGLILDHLVIGAPYTSGVYQEVDFDGSVLRFRFEGESLWTLTPKVQGSRGLFDLPPGARRRGGLLAPRYLFLSWEQTG